MSFFCYHTLGTRPIPFTAQSYLQCGREVAHHRTLPLPRSAEMHLLLRYYDLYDKTKHDHYAHSRVYKSGVQSYRFGRPK